MKIKFSGKDCMPCPSREKCIRSVKEYKRRTVTVRRPREHHEALQRARERERTVEFKAEYTKRAGIEGTVSRAVRTCGVRRSRYVGLDKTHLCHVLELSAGGRVADGSAQSQNQALAVRPAGGSTGCRLMNSPAVSRVRETHH
jgi:hypothetical protein